MGLMLVERSVDLVKRRNCYYDVYGRYYCYNSSFYNWGRWVLLGVILFVFFLLFFCLSCTSRRRRAKGAKPFYGTGWMSQGPLAPPPYQAQAPAPPYAPQENGTYKGPTPPQPTYGNAGNQGYEMNNNMNNHGYQGYQGYQPPPGPPPNQYR